MPPPAELRTIEDEDRDAALAAPVDSAVSHEEVSALVSAIREMMVQAKARHRNLERSGDQGRVSVLFTLAKDGPVRPSALAKEIALDLSTVSRHLRTLEEEGQVERSADPDDGRAFKVGLTPQGLAFCTEFWLRRVNAVHTALSDWAPEDVRTLADLLRRFARDTEGCM